MSFYAPSPLSQVLLPVGVVCGVVASDALSLYMRLDGLWWYPLIALMIAVCAGIGFFAYGHGITIDEVQRSLTVCPYLFGIPIGDSNRYSFDEVRGLKKFLDADGYPSMRLELKNKRRYWLFSIRVARDFEWLRKEFGLRE